MKELYYSERPKQGLTKSEKKHGCLGQNYENALGRSSLSITADRWLCGCI